MLDDVLQGAHVHVLDDLFDQPVLEETGVELDHVGTVPSTQVLSQVVQQLLAFVG